MSAILRVMGDGSPRCVGTRVAFPLESDVLSLRAVLSNLARSRAQDHRRLSLCARRPALEARGEVGR